MATERIPTGGALVPYDAGAAFVRDPQEFLRQRLKGLPDMSGLQNIPMGRVGFAGGMIAPALTAVSEAQAGRPTGALGALGVGLLGSATGVGIGKLALGGLAATPGLPGLIGKLGQAALPVIGGIIAAPAGAELAERGKRSLTGDPTTGKDDLKNKLAERGLISNQGIADQEYLNMQRMNPLLQKMENAKLVRAQALMASQGQQYAMLGTLATAGKLATGSQAEMGATLRTALQSNPYASSNLQAPSIAFG
jgi:hypothetical protein